MGCDIHVHTEKLITTIGKTQQWINTDHFMFAPQYNNEEPELQCVDIYNSRDYHLFGILTGGRVRYTTDDVHEMSIPRGLPEDVSLITKREYDKYDDWHSASSFTLHELYEYRDKMKKRKHECWVLKSEAVKIDGNPEYCPPEGSCKPRDVGVGWAYRKWNELYPGFKYLLKCIEKKAEEDFNIYYLDKKKRKEYLRKHADEYRIVFWFDS